MFRTIASATAASAAAMIIMNSAKICPSIENIPYRANATKLMLAAFRINSIPSKTAIAFLLVVTANIPNIDPPAS